MIALACLCLQQLSSMRSVPTISDEPLLDVLALDRASILVVVITVLEVEACAALLDMLTWPNFIVAALTAKYFWVRMLLELCDSRFKPPVDLLIGRRERLRKPNRIVWMRCFIDSMIAAWQLTFRRVRDLCVSHFILSVLFLIDCVPNANGLHQLFLFGIRPPKIDVEVVLSNILQVRTAFSSLRSGRKMETELQAFRTGDRRL